MVDIHSHILPGVDDGSDSVLESLDMLRTAAESGVKAIVATPHTNLPGLYENLYDAKLKSLFALLKQEAEKKRIPVSVLEGQEVFCQGKVLTYLREGKIITLNSSRYLLVEFDFYERAVSVYNKLKRIIAEGYVPIVAHPERYAFVRETSNNILPIIDSGCFLQINKGSIEGSFGLEVQDTAFKLLSRRFVSAVASDAHSPFSRTTNMDSAFEIVAEEFGLDYADLVFTNNPNNIILNKSLD